MLAQPLLAIEILEIMSEIEQREQEAIRENDRKTHHGMDYLFVAGQD